MKHTRELTLEELANVKDNKINFSDIPKLNKNFFKTARLLMPPAKKPVTFRLDDDVLDWFKKRGKGYQSHMNAALKAYMAMHLK